MKNRIVLLGHHNFGLSLVIDNLYAIYGIDIELVIVENRPSSANSDYAYPYAVNMEKVTKVDIDQWQSQDNDHYYLSTVSGKSRKALFLEFQEKFQLNEDDFPQIIHPSALISPSAKIGNGVYIGPGSIVGPFAKIGNHSFINRISTVGHHSELKNFTSLSAEVNIASRAEIQSCVTLNMGVTVFDQVTVGANSIVGGGSLVIKNIPADVVSYGRPAKTVRAI